MFIFYVILETLFIAVCSYGGARVALIMHERDKRKENEKGVFCCECERRKSSQRREEETE